jgi:hypothetical protein
MMDGQRTWSNDDGAEYIVTTSMGIISAGAFAREEAQAVIEFQAASGEAWRTAYSASTSLHRQPDWELRSYLGTAKHDPPIRPPRVR